MRTRIGTRLMLGAGLVTSLVIGVMAVLISGRHAGQLQYELTQSANQVSETIKSSTHYDMLENRRDDLHRQIRQIGLLKQEGIQKVRLFNREGKIMFSSRNEEIGTSLDKKGEACYICHAEGQPLERLDIQQRARVFRAPDGTRILGIINPIPNEQSCWTAACHAHSKDQKVLGVLDVNLSLAQADRAVRTSRMVLFSLAGLAIVASSLIIWWLNRRLVLRPVANLLAGTRRVAEGDLTTTIPATGNHELGDLAQGFNAMTRRLAETQLQLTQADKLASVGRLAAGIAHEINNPLTGVLTYASLLQKRHGVDPQDVEDLEVIVRETKRCRGIIRELLDFARPTAPVRKPTDLNEVVRKSLAVVMNQLSLNHVELSLALVEDLPRAYADANQIQQVVVNLLLNAADAIGTEGGRIHLATGSAEVVPVGKAAIDWASGAIPMVELQVEDTGSGIPADALPHIFEPFFTSKGNRGTGLGLAVTWGIIEGHGGRIDVDSEPGRGTRFTVRLPLASAGGDLPAGPAPSA
jgi:two-component system NtrC family sensor kinase